MTVSEDMGVYNISPEIFLIGTLHYFYKTENLQGLKTDTPTLSAQVASGHDQIVHHHHLLPLPGFQGSVH